MEHLKKGLAALMTSLLLLAGAATFSAAPATAAGTCTHNQQTREQIGPDAHRVVASCSWIAYNYKARGNLVRRGGPDYHTQWFTRLNTAYYSGFYTCYAGCWTSAETRPV